MFNNLPIYLLVMLRQLRLQHVRLNLVLPLWKILCDNLLGCGAVSRVLLCHRQNHLVFNMLRGSQGATLAYHSLVVQSAEQLVALHPCLDLVAYLIQD
jgi:hypothetical protein